MMPLPQLYFLHIFQDFNDHVYSLSRCALVTLEGVAHLEFWVDGLLLYVDQLDLYNFV